MKQVAQQEAEKARYLVEKAEQMKLAAVTTGSSLCSRLLKTVQTTLEQYQSVLRGCPHVFVAPPFSSCFSASKMISFLTVFHGNRNSQSLV